MTEPDGAEQPGAGGLDRRRDLAGWLLTPLITLAFAPALAGAVAVVVLLGGGFKHSPALCATARTDNLCEETTLSVLGGHAVVFGGLWLALWAVPWWRGLRWPRVGLALIASAVLVALPIRMAA